MLTVSRRVGWIVLFIASGACLIQLQHWFLRLAARFKLQGAGGWVGYFFGRHVFRSWMGKGSVIVLAGLYLTSLILMTGLRPIHLVRQSVLATRRGFVALRLWLLRRRMRKADLKGQLEISQQQIAKQQRAIEKSCARKARRSPNPRRRWNLPIVRNQKWSIPPRSRRRSPRRARNRPSPN